MQTIATVEYNTLQISVGMIIAGLLVPNVYSRKYEKGGIKRYQ